MRNVFRSPKHLVSISAFPVLALLLAWISNSAASVSGWLAFLILLVTMTGVTWLIHSILRNESPPTWLPRLTFAAALLRILAGVLWFTLLPAYGYETDVQQAGYIMEDAFQRDTVSWQLAVSNEPLSAAFSNSYRNADQYGGLLFVFSAIYRMFGGEAHQPLLIIILTAFASAWTVPLGWAFARRVFGDRTAAWSAWLITLFPEAILLGSSQMREAVIMPLAAAAFYGLAVFAGKGSHPDRKRGLIWMIVPFIILAPISPPFAIIILGLAGIIGLALFNFQFWRNWRFWAAAGSTALLLVIILWAGWPQIAPRINAEAFNSPFEMAVDWLRYVSRWQAYLSERASGWLQKIFRETPEWFDLPFLIGYGVTRPLLPAQLIATSTPLWWVIGLWRSIGWTLMLAVLLYAPIQAIRSKDDRALRFALTAAVWAAVIYASFWGGGDQWDNPRYRVALIALQSTLTAAVIVKHQHSPDPWLRRLMLMAGTFLTWFFFWYLRRYTFFNDFLGWTVYDIFKISGAALLTGVLLVIWDMAAPSKIIMPGPSNGPTH